MTMASRCVWRCRRYLCKAERPLLVQCPAGLPSPHHTVSLPSDQNQHPTVGRDQDSLALDTQRCSPVPVQPQADEGAGVEQAHDRVGDRHVPQHRHGRQHTAGNPQRPHHNHRPLVDLQFWTIAERLVGILRARAPGNSTTTPRQATTGCYLHAGSDFIRCPKQPLQTSAQG